MLLLALALLLLMALLLVGEGTCVGSAAGSLDGLVSSLGTCVCTLVRRRAAVVSVASRSLRRAI